MKRHLRHISTVNMTREEWLTMRLSQSEVGASDVGTIMNQNPWMPALKLFHQKIGLWPKDMDDSAASYGGRVLEEVVAKHYWPYWSPDSPTMETMLKNAGEDKVIRKCNKVNFVAKNPDYPWILVNMDREFSGGKDCLEIKTASGFAVNKWESGLPVYHILQHQTCLGVAEMPQGELALLKDGRYFDVFPFTQNDAIFAEILTRTKEFYEKVVEGRKIMASDLSLEEQLRAVTQLEPSADGSMAYEEYMKERYRSDYQTEKIAGTSEMLGHAKHYLSEHNNIKIAEAIKRDSGNHLRDFMIQNKANEIIFDAGSVKWGKKSNGHDQFFVSPDLLTA